MEEQPNTMKPLHAELQKDLAETRKAPQHDPKETIKEHATDKFTDEKVEREIPDQESIVTELDPVQNTTDGNFNPDK